MRHTLLEILSGAPFGVHVMGKEIAGLAGVNDDVGFRNRPTQRHAPLADRIVLEKAFLDDHASRPFLTCQQFIYG